MTHVPSVNGPHVHVHGAVGARITAYAVEKLEAALKHSPAPVVSSWLTLDAMAPGNRVDADANVNGVHVHVHASGATLREATDLMQEKLRSRLRGIRRRPAQGPPAPTPAAADDDPSPRTGPAGGHDD